MADQTPVDLSLRIRQAAKAKGIDPDTLVNIARAESTLRPQAKSKTSSSRGLFGVIDSTWVQHGGDPARRGDIDEDIRVGAEVVSQNKKRFEKLFKRAPRPAELYAFHVFGAGAAPEILRADKDKPMAEVVGQKTLKANPYWKNKTVGQVLSQFENKMGGSTALASNNTQKAAPLIDVKKIRGSIPAMAPLTSNEPAKDRFTPQTVAQLGPSYQAAMAAMALGDTSDDDEDEAVTQRLAEKADEAEAAKPIAPRRSVFEDMGMSYSSPFDEVASAAPVGLADGGDPAMEKSDAREMLDRFANGGPVYRAEGSPMYGESSMPAPKTPEEMQQMMYKLQLQGQSTPEMIKENLAGGPTIKALPESFFSKASEGARKASEFINRAGTAADVAKLIPGYTGETKIPIPTAYNFGPKMDPYSGQVIPGGLQTEEVPYGKVLEAIKPADMLGLTGVEKTYEALGARKAPKVMDVVDTVGLGAAMAKAPQVAMKATRSMIKAGEKATKAAGKLAASSGPQIESALMKVAPAAEPMYISRPVGGIFPTSGTWTKDAISKLDEGIKETNQYLTAGSPGRPPVPEEVEPIVNFFDNKVRNYVRNQAGTVSDPVREALLSGKIKIPKDSKYEEMFPQALIDAARRGDVTSMKLLEKELDKSLQVKTYKTSPAYDPLASRALLEDTKGLMLQQMKENPGIIPDSMLLRIAKKNAEDLPLDKQTELIANIRAKLKENPNLFNTVYEEKIMRLMDEDPTQVITASSLRDYPRGYPALVNIDKSKEGIMALEKNAPIMDVEQSHFKIMGLSLRELADAAQLVPAKEMERMGVTELINKAMEFSAKADQAETLAKRTESILDKGKKVPEKISTYGTTPFIEPDKTGFMWREITDPQATKIQAKMLKNSIAGYSRPGNYGSVEKGIRALRDGEVRLFGLYDKDNQLMTNVEYITDKSSNPVLQNTIKQMFGNGPLTGNVEPLNYPYQMLSLIEKLKPDNIPPSISRMFRELNITVPK